MYFVLFILIVGCGGKTETPEAPGAAAGRDTAATLPMTDLETTTRAKRLVSFMSLEEKCAQVLLLSIGSTRRISPEFRARFKTIPAGGVLLMRYNLADDPKEIGDLTSDLQDHARESGRGIPLFIAVDHEGGTVFRFGRVATRLPDASILGTAGRAGLSRDTLYDLYLNAARQLAALGFSMNLAPVLEPLNDENRKFLQYRAYSSDPEQAAELGGIVIDAMRDGGILAVGKHFPGSGDGDPHKGLPSFSYDLRDQEQPQILSFRRAVKEHRLAALMTSHVLAPSLDPGLPVTLSSRVQKDYLRDTLGFGGIVLTDDINMRALTEGRDPEKAAVMAIAAGADMIMYLAEDIAGIHAALVRAVQETAAGASGDGGLPTARVGGLSEARLDEAVTRIIEQKLLLDLWNRSRELTEAVITAGGTEARGPAASEGAALGRRLEEFGRLKAEGDALLRRIKAP